MFQNNCFFSQKKNRNTLIVNEGKKQIKIASLNSDRPAKNTSNRMSYKEKRELELLPIKITKFEREIASLNQEISNAGLSILELQKLSDELEKKTRSLAQSEERWIELALLEEG